MKYSRLRSILLGAAFGASFLVPEPVQAMQAGQQAALDNTAITAYLMAAVISAVALGLAAAYVRWRTGRAEKQNPPAGKFVEVSGVKLHYVDRGHGPFLVLFHGNGTMIQDFVLSGVVDQLEDKYRVIVFDRPGYGYSSRPRKRFWNADAQAELFHDAFRALGIQQPIVVGHSWGAFVALAMALKYPKDVSGVVLASGYYFPTIRLDVPVLASPAIPVIGDLMRYTISPLLGRLMWPGLIRYLFDPSPVANQFRRFPTWMALRPSQLRASAEETALMIPNTFALKPRYERLSVPTILVAGDGDRHVNTNRHSVRLHEQLPHTRLMIVPRAGHMVHQIAPQYVVDAIDTVAEMTSACEVSLGDNAR